MRARPRSMSLLHLAPWPACTTGQQVPPVGPSLTPGAVSAATMLTSPATAMSWLSIVSEIGRALMPGQTRSSSALRPQQLDRAVSWGSRPALGRSVAPHCWHPTESVPISPSPTSTFFQPRVNQRATAGGQSTTSGGCSSNRGSPARRLPGQQKTARVPPAPLLRQTPSMQKP